MTKPRISFVLEKEKSPALGEALMERNTDDAFQILVGRAGFEPATNGLKVRCSTS
jgi:hypothetical protein